MAPTLAGLLGVPMTSAPGSDWSAQLRGETDRTSRDRAFADTWFRDVSRAAVYAPDHACQLDFTTPAGDDPRFVDGCFDRAADPLHAHPIDHPELRDELVRWRGERIEEGLRFGAARLAEPGPGLDAQLEALGYARGDE